MVFFYAFVFLCILLEMFPISSSGHLQLFTDYFHSMYLLPLFSSTTLSLFSDLLHLPIAIVLFLFFLKLTITGQNTFVIKKDFLIFIIVADIVTCFFYVFFKHIHIPSHFLPFGFILTGLLLFSLLFTPPASTDSLSINAALLFGLVQGISLLPGISRFAATYTLGRWIGFSSANAFVLSFSIQVPLLIAASMKALFILGASVPFVSSFVSYGVLWISVITASIISWFCLQWVYSLCLNDQLWWFSLYMLLPLISWFVLNR